MSYRYCLPNKLFEYIMCGLPVIVSDLPEMSQIVDKFRIGVVAKGLSPVDLKEAFAKELELDGDVSARGVEAARQNFCWEKEEVKLGTFYLDFIGRKDIGFA